MQITYLGHAGFYVETEQSVIMMDPWLSTHGAFDSAWFQYPQNTALQKPTLERFESTRKDKYIYISHEHKDHFDLPFLKQIKTRNFKIILANFNHSIVKEALEACQYECEQILALNDEEPYFLQDGEIRLFIIDAELDCDSAIVVKTNAGRFLNVNDSKIHDKLAKITKENGPFDVFAGQFSGAIWHPVCYDFPEKEYQMISLKKKLNKFATVARGIKTVNPALYLASAGPPCFLDPMLFHINFEKINIFPRAPEFLGYLKKHGNLGDVQCPEIMPGDTLDVASRTFTHLSENRVSEADFKQYVTAYADQYKGYFEQRERNNKKVSPQDVFERLRQDLENKLAQLTLINVQVSAELYWQISECPEKMYRINLAEKTIVVTDKIADPTHYWKIESPAWQVNKVLNNEMNWPDFVLAFRAKLTRVPNLYDMVIHGFIAIDACEMARFSELVAQFHSNKTERIIIEYEGKRYSILRWCPHLGGDLSAGWLENGSWVCPRHQWHYDLCNQGKCLTSTETIEAICLDDDTKKQKD